MRAQFVPVPTVVDQNGVYKMADWLNAGYLSNLTSLTIESQYVLQARDCPYPELLSYRKYGTVDYWWILCTINGSINPMTDMLPGLTWAIPSYDSIQKMLADSSLGTAGTSKTGQLVTL